MAVLVSAVLVFIVRTDIQTDRQIDRITHTHTHTHTYRDRIIEVDQRYTHATTVGMRDLIYKPYLEKKKLLVFLL